MTYISAPSCVWWLILQAFIRAPIPPWPSPAIYRTPPGFVTWLPIHCLPVATASAMSSAMNDLYEPGGPYRAAKPFSGSTFSMIHLTGSSLMVSHASMLSNCGVGL